LNVTPAIEVRWAEGRVEGLAEIAAEFVRLSIARRNATALRRRDAATCGI
jgi:hypothetical protein